LPVERHFETWARGLLAFAVTEVAAGGAEHWLAADPERPLAAIGTYAA
jgi:hypothetical protein